MTTKELRTKPVQIPHVLWVDVDFAMKSDAEPTDKSTDASIVLPVGCAGRNPPSHIGGYPLAIYRRIMNSHQIPLHPNYFPLSFKWCFKRTQNGFMCLWEFSKLVIPIWMGQQPIVTMFGGINSHWPAILGYLGCMVFDSLPLSTKNGFLKRVVIA